MSAEKVREVFDSTFHHQPRVFFSPGRINLIGEHIDYNDGFVMPAAIDKGLWFAVAANNTDKVNLYSVDLKESYSTTLQDIQLVKGWQNYLLGIVDQVQKKQLNLGGFDCCFGGNLPVGAGLSSSAAVECGLLFALNEIFQFQLSRVDIALMGQQAEHTFPKVMCGIMDQFASSMGKKEHVILLDCQSLDYRYLPLKLEEYTLVLINSKVHHSLADGEYNKRRQQCQEGFSILQSHLPEAKSFRDLTPQNVIDNKNFLDPVIFNRCLFVTEEIKRTQSAATLLENNELKAFGKLMYDTHEGLSKLYEVSCPELDFLVEKARAGTSIIGSRLMGGGFGGCTLNLIEKKNWEAIIQNIIASYKEAFSIDAEVYKVGVGDGTYEIAQ